MAAGDLLLGGPAAAALALDPALDGDKKIVNEFILLYNESRQLFNGLR